MGKEGGEKGNWRKQRGKRGDAREKEERRMNGVKESGRKSGERVMIIIYLFYFATI